MGPLLCGTVEFDRRRRGGGTSGGSRGGDAVGQPRDEAEAALQVLELIQGPAGRSWKWWTQSQPIRTLAELPLGFPLVDTAPSLVYLQIAEKVSGLHRLGMSACAIARVLKVSDKTVTRALRRGSVRLQEGL